MLAEVDPIVAAHRIVTSSTSECGPRLGEADADGDPLADGDRDAEILAEGLRLALALAEGDRLAEGLTEALGETEAEALEIASLNAT